MILIFVGPSSFGCVEPRVMLDIGDGDVCQSSNYDDTKNLLYMQYVYLWILVQHLSKIYIACTCSIIIRGLMPNLSIL